MRVFASCSPVSGLWVVITQRSSRMRTCRVAPPTRTRRPSQASSPCAPTPEKESSAESGARRAGIRHATPQLGHRGFGQHGDVEARRRRNSSPCTGTGAARRSATVRRTTRPRSRRADIAHRRSSRSPPLPLGRAPRRPRHRGSQAEGRGLERVAGAHLNQRAVFALSDQTAASSTRKNRRSSGMPFGPMTARSTRWSASDFTGAI